jgi:transposase-like protein
MDIETAKKEVLDRKNTAYKAKPYAPDVKEFIITQAREALARGESLNKISSDFGLGSTTLQKWLDCDTPQSGPESKFVLLRKPQAEPAGSGEKQIRVVVENNRWLEVDQRFIFRGLSLADVIEILHDILK